MTNAEKLEELSIVLESAKKDMVWAISEAEKNTKNEKLGNQATSHKSHFEKLSEQFQELQNEIDLNESANDEYQEYNRSEGTFEDVKAIFNKKPKI